MSPSRVARRFDRAPPRRRPTRKRPKLRPAARRAGSPQPPRAVEHYFVAQLVRIQSRISKAIADALYSRLKDIAKPEPEEREDAVRLDAPPAADGGVGGAAVKEAIEALTKATEKATESGTKTLDIAAQTAAKRTVKHSQSEFERIGIPVPKEPNFQRVVKKWSKETADRLKGTTESQRDKIVALLEDGHAMRHETLAKEIARQVEDVSASRAEFLARDSVLSLNAAINESRMVEAGVEEYIWSTSQDERVREEHAEREGETFRWDDPPEDGHPGEAALCRCVPFPVLPELDGANGEPRPEEETPPTPSTESAATQIEKGRHVRNLDFSDVASNKAMLAAAEGVVASIDDQGTLEFLERHPFRRIAVQREVYSGRESVNGDYRISTDAHDLRVALARNKLSYGYDFTPGAAPSISESEKTAAKAAKATMRHEIGHHIHLVGGEGSEVDNVVTGAFARATASNKFITQYASTDPMEYFSESYAAYHGHRREALRAHDPNGFAMVESVLRLRGILK